MVDDTEVLERASNGDKIALELLLMQGRSYRLGCVLQSIVDRSSDFTEAEVDDIREFVGEVRFMAERALGLEGMGPGSWD